MSISIKQCEKVLKKAGVKYSTITKNRIVLRDSEKLPLPIFIENDSDILRVYIFIEYSRDETEVSFKFNSLTHDEQSLYFSYKGNEPLVVKIK